MIRLDPCFVVPNSVVIASDRAQRVRDEYLCSAPRSS